MNHILLVFILDIIQLDNLIFFFSMLQIGISKTKKRVRQEKMSSVSIKIAFITTIRWNRNSSKDHFIVNFHCVWTTFTERKNSRNGSTNAWWKICQNRKTTWRCTTKNGEQVLFMKLFINYKQPVIFAVEIFNYLTFHLNNVHGHHRP